MSMATSLEKLTAHCIAIIGSRRGRIFLVLVVAIVTIYLFLSRTDDFYRQSSTVLYKNPSKTNDLDWSKYAYIQYATSSEYLCISVMLLERLHHLGSRADRVLMYPVKMLPDPEMGDGWGFHDAELLLKAQDEYNVKLMPIQVQHRDTIDDTWSDSYTKLLAFNLTQYERVITIDADVTILKHMDELFHLPPCPIAMPRAYWLLGDATPRMTLASHVMVIQPSEREFDRIQKRVQVADKDEYDMELLNKLYIDSAMVLPHRPYAMISSEFRETDHHLYLGSETEEWDPVAVLGEVRTVHFSDFPVPKPWKAHLNTDDRDNLVKLEPKCVMKKKGDGSDDKVEDCSGRDAWRELYADFRERKAMVCARQWLKHEDERYIASKEEIGGVMDAIPYVEQDDDGRFLSV